MTLPPYFIVVGNNLPLPASYRLEHADQQAIQRHVRKVTTTQPATPRSPSFAIGSTSGSDGKRINQR
jgi:hypothetical protein